ncbi:MAG: dehydratase [Anaerolineae bacterium]|nr:MaoC family dehydratase N-terminal domain-containing protein [Anaerolineae bacterium]MCQ3979686.1 dehydratase [Anaerolineae bacterium]GIK39059.1 MAG: MaoC family dehydratase [Chloroflexota bacterium]
MSHTCGLSFDQFEIGAKYISAARTVTEADVVAFAGLSGDFNPLHTNAEFCKETPFGERIAHGMLIVSMATGMANWTGIFEGTTLALLEQVIRYKGAVKFGDTIHLEQEVLEKKESSKPDRGVVIFASRVRNQRDEVVIDGEWTLLMKRDK